MPRIPVELANILKSVEKMVVLTGAGVSQESGLRTFRDTQVGLWEQYRPEDLATPEAFARNPKLVWDWYAMRREKIKEVEPNAGHYALVAMARKIPSFRLITQNIDGLHQKAGSVDILELHGNIQKSKCSVCGKHVTEWYQPNGTIPQCTDCNGLLRPDVVWFGESLPRIALERAVSAARNCEVFFSVGTSGLVQPAASLIFAAKNNDALLVELNINPTALSEKVDFFLNGKSGDLLPELVSAVWG